MPYKSVMIENENNWKDIKKLALVKHKTLGGFIEEILIKEISAEKEQSLTPERVAMELRKRFLKDDLLFENDISTCFGETFIKRRKFNEIIRDLELNNVVRKASEKQGKNIFKGWRLV